MKNPKPETRNPKPETRNPKPEIRGAEHRGSYKRMASIISP